MSTVFLNGAFVSRAEARVSAFDAAFQHGVGLFETMLALRTAGDEFRIIGLDAHTERLAASASALGLSDDLSGMALGEAALETARRAGLDRARIRLSVTGGDLNLLEARGTTNHAPTILINAQPATRYPDAMFERGVMAVVADAKANPLDPTAGHKTVNYWWRLRELQRAAAAGAGEALVFQVSNHIAGGCVSNLFLVRNDRVYTPIARGEEAELGLPSPVLPGVTRGMVMGWCDEMGLDLSRQMLAIDDVLSADELMLTNSSWGILPVTSVEARPIASGEPGPITRRLMARWREATATTRAPGG